MLEGCLSSRALGTISGLTAVFFWSITAPVITFAVGVNPFLFLTVDHSIAFSFFVIKWFALRQNPIKEFRTLPLWFALLGIFALPTHSLTWVIALQQAPPLEATLIIYLWPLLVVLLSTIVLRQSLRWHHIGGAVLGLFGMAILLLGRGLTLDHITLMPGHGYALLCALSWSVFAAISAKQTNLSSNIYGLIFFFSACGNGLYWWLGAGAPTAPGASLLIVACAAVSSVAGYALWDFGSKHGNTQLIGVASFLTPVLAAFYLVALGKAVWTPYLAAALGAVVLGIGLAKYGADLHRRSRQQG